MEYPIPSFIIGIRLTGLYRASGKTYFPAWACCFNKKTTISSMRNKKIQKNLKKFANLVTVAKICGYYYSEGKKSLKSNQKKR